MRPIPPRRNHDFKAGCVPASDRGGAEVFIFDGVIKEIKAVASAVPTGARVPGVIRVHVHHGGGAVAGTRVVVMVIIMIMTVMVMKMMVGPSSSGQSFVVKGQGTKDGQGQ